MKIFLDLPGVAQALSVSESTVRNLMRTADFPQPRELSGRRVGWLVREVVEWAESRPVSNMLPPPGARDDASHPPGIGERTRTSMKGCRAGGVT